MDALWTVVRQSHDFLNLCPSGFDLLIFIEQLVEDRKAMIHAILAATFVTAAFLILGFTGSGAIAKPFKAFVFLYSLSLFSWLALGITSHSYGLISISLFQLLGLVFSLFSFSKEVKL
ncbi:MAG: hypothetical protein AAF202_11650 [Pseudomonadota bacterium]